MASDDETNDSQSKLNQREQFPGWKAKMSLLAMAKAPRKVHARGGALREALGNV